MSEGEVYYLNVYKGQSHPKSEKKYFYFFNLPTGIGGGFLAMNFKEANEGLLEKLKESKLKRVNLYSQEEDRWEWKLKQKYLEKMKIYLEKNINELEVKIINPPKIIIYGDKHDGKIFFGRDAICQ